jgi:DNA replication protein DnaC
MTLEEKLRQLTLTTMAQQVETVTSQAAAQNLSFPAARERLADLEREARHGRAIERRFKLSRLPAQPALDPFRFTHHKSRQQAKNRILRLLDLDFLKQGTSIVIIGNPGVGKTFWAHILGWRACQANVRVLFTTARDMLNRLLASQVDHSLVRKLKTYTEPTFLFATSWGISLWTRRPPTSSTRSSRPVMPTSEVR